MAKGARCLLKQANLFEAEKKNAEAVGLMQKAKAAFQQYLDYAKNPANALSDPQFVAARETAVAEARYSIADANDSLVSAASSASEKAALWKETLATLKDFEKEFASQSSLVIFALYRRLDANMGLENYAAAEADYEAMKKVDSSHRFTAAGGVKVASQLKKDAEAKWDALVGDKFFFSSATPEEIQRAEGKAGYQEVCKELLHAYDLYRDYLLTSKSAQEDFKNWNAIGFYYYKIGEWETCSEIYSKAVERFEGQAPADDMLRVKDRLLTADFEMAKAAEVAGNKDVAARLWHECGRLLDALRAEGQPKALSRERVAADVFGGFVAKNKAGFYTEVTALGRYDDAVPIWRALLERARAVDPGGDQEWEAKFYFYYVLFKQRQAKNETTKDIKKALDQLRLVSPELGGKDKWKPLFEWFDRMVTAAPR